MPDETLSPVPEQKQQKPLRRLLGYLLKARGRIAVTFVLSFEGTLLALIPAVQVGRIINGPIADGDKTQLAWDLLVLLAFAAGGFLGMWFGGRVLAVAAQEAMYRLRKEVFEHTQTLSLRFFDRQPIGDLMSRITNDLDSVGQLFDKGLSPAINSAFTLLITTALMFWVSWQLSIAVVLIAPLILLLMQITSHYSGPAFSVLQERTGALNGAAEELITGDRTVKAYLVEDRAAAKLEQLSDEARAAGVRANFTALTAMPLSSMLSNLDVAPTLLELAGVAPPPSWRGRSLLRAAPRAAIVLEGAEREEIGVRTTRWLFTVKGRVDESATITPAWTAPGALASLYDLAADPGETRNVYRAGHPAAADLIALVEPISAMIRISPRLRPAASSARSSAWREPDPGSRTISGSVRSSSIVASRRPFHRCPGGTTRRSSSGINAFDSSPLFPGSAPTTPASTCPSRTAWTMPRVSEIWSVIATRGCRSRNRPMTAGRTYSPGIVLAPTSRVPVTCPRNWSSAWRASTARASCAPPSSRCWPRRAAVASAAPGRTRPPASAPPARCATTSRSSAPRPACPGSACCWPAPRRPLCPTAST